ncbi:MAG: N-acetyltransferase [Flavobacteriales bacterium]|nr:MAG: N-acetyltransferase [Flavobacteriales bacterium]
MGINKINLRALELDDLEFLFKIENDSKFQKISSSILPFSKHYLEKYIMESNLDIFLEKQFRFVISIENNNPIGLIDLFDFDPINHRAGIGIVIINTHRKKGYALESVKLIEDISKKDLQIHQLYVSVGVDNKSSLNLFKKLGYLEIGVKKDWNYVNGQYIDELLFQKILSNE